MPPRSRPPERVRLRHHFSGVRPTSPLRLIVFLLLTLGAIWLLLRQSGS